MNQQNKTYLLKKESSTLLENNENPASLFLDEAHFYEIKRENYDLSREFAKTVEHKNWSFYYVILSFLMVLALFTAILVGRIQDKSSILSISISDFEDLNLAEALNKAKETEKELSYMRIALEKSKKQFELDSQAIQREAKEKALAILKQNLPEAEKQKMILEIREKEKKELEALQQSYQNEIKAKEKQMLAIQAQMKEYEEKYKEDLKKARAQVLSDSAKLHEIEMEKQRKIYENKIAEITLQNQRELKKNKEFIDNLLKEYEEKEKELRQKEKLLKSYLAAFDYLLKNERERGYVLDASNLEEIIVVINSNYPVEKGEKAIIVDEEDKKVAEIELFPGKTYTSAKIIGKKKEIIIQPFYKILLNTKP